MIFNVANTIADKFQFQNLPQFNRTKIVVIAI